MSERSHDKAAAGPVSEHVGSLLSRAADQWRDREFIVLGDQRFTFGDIWRWTTVVASDLVEWGLKPGDRLLWQLPNSMDAIVLHFAAWRAGIVSVPVVSLYREHEVRSIFAQAAPAAVVFEGSNPDATSMVAAANEVVARADGKPPLAILAGSDATADGYRIRRCPAVDEAVSDTALPVLAGADELALILFTSGTTSSPKGVMHTSRSLLVEAASWRGVIGLDSNMVSLMGAPISHIAGMLTALVVPALLGGRAVVMERWNADRAVELIDCERVTVSSGARVFLHELVERYENSGFTGRRLSTFLGGGANIDPELILRADALGVKAFRSWGMTEAPTLTLAHPNDPLERRAYFDGRLVDGAVVEAVDEDRRPLPAGSNGELRLKCGEQMLGYLDPQHTLADVDEEGWFYSGDIGTVDSDGWVRITGRRKDIINRGGEKFSARDIEEAISSHPAIMEAAIVGTPHARFGEQVTAFVVVRDGMKWPGRDAIISHLQEAQLARQKFPVAWRILEELPKTLSGKVQKHQLMKLWQDALTDIAEPG